MEKKVLEKYIKAGKIASAIRKKAGKEVKEGQKILEVCERIEKEIFDQEGKPAFPVNFSRNNEAAHYTASINDSSVVGEKDVIKIDIGVHIDGYIADCAITVDLSEEFGKMTESSEKALENALSLVKVGRRIGEIGEEIEKTIKGFGFEPVRNLSGHGLQEYEAHAFPIIPNHANKDTKELEEDMAFAIEPFSTNGKGLIRESSQTEIYSLNKIVAVRSLIGRKILQEAEKFKGLPFAERWINERIKMSEFERKIAFRELMQKEALATYPVLREEKGMTVTQAETSIVLDGEKPIVLVK